MKTKSKITGYIIRSSACAVFLSVAFIAASSAFQPPNKWYESLVATVGYGSTAKSPSQPRALSFAERVAYQRAIEDVYWRHRIWPKENPDRKPALEALMSQAQVENKVRGYLRDSLVLEDYWQRPITAEQLQTEMERMARDTKQPEVLRELFAALGNDPAVIAECLARPILAERLIADLSAQNKIRHVESPQTEALRTMSVATTLGQVVYTLPEIANACTDQWGATSTTNAPQARQNHTAVWTGAEMIVWGGTNPPTYTGGRYNPSTDSWTTTSTTNAPSAQSGPAVWTGTEMIVWSGTNDSAGGRYNPTTDSWTATTTNNAPSARGGHTAVWTGSKMIVWGGTNGTDWLNTGGRYDAATNSWTATSVTNAPAGRSLHTAVWTGSAMIVWGGEVSLTGLSTGGRYNPSTDSWTDMSTTNAPAARYLHTAVWTDSEMIVWGGMYPDMDTGGRYNPATDTWIATSITNAPSPRWGHTAVWTGSEMTVWGGAHAGYEFNTGRRYDPSANTWTATSMTNAPTTRFEHTAVWTGSEMIVWGGYNGNTLNTGGRYCGGPYPTPTPTPTPLPAVIANPTFNPQWGGLYTMPMTVTLTCTTPGTTIYYSLEKMNEPPTHWTVYPPGGVVIPAGAPLHHSLYVQAKLTDDPTRVSQVVERIYHTASPPVANPTFNPQWGGVYSMPMTVTLTCATEGTTIYYSLEKMNEPPTHWTVYPSGGVVIPAGVPLHHSLYAQAKLTADPNKVSQVVERIYHTK